MTIPGGYYLKARCIKDKPIAHAPPIVREVWDYLLREANYKDRKYRGFSIKRGQLFRSYREIREALHWVVGWRKETYNENQMKGAMRYLKKRTMITTRKAPGGVLITIINYDTYQDPTQYENTSESPNESTTENTRRTPERTDNNNKDKKERKKKAKKLFSENSNEFRLAVFLLNHIKNHKPDFKEPNLQTWAKTADLMMRIDGRDIEMIKAVISWSQADEFWQGNVLSMSKLRKQFDALEIKMRERPGKKQPEPKRERSLSEIADAMIQNEDGSITLDFERNNEGGNSENNFGVSDVGEFSSFFGRGKSLEAPKLDDGTEEHHGRTGNGRT